MVALSLEEAAAVGEVAVGLNMTALVQIYNGRLCAGSRGQDGQPGEAPPAKKRRQEKGGGAQRSQSDQLEKKRARSEEPPADRRDAPGLRV